MEGLTGHIETSPRRVRVMLGGETIADTIEARLVWEHPYYPQWYVPRAALTHVELHEVGSRESKTFGSGQMFDIVAGSARADAAATIWADHPDLVRLDFAAMDHWFEEDEEVFVHPRDPYKRIEILPSSRHIRVEVDGVTVADTHHPTLLVETGLPPRWYLPPIDIRLDLLVSTDTSTACPYKGVAHYWSVVSGDTTHPDLAWGYPTTTRESDPVAGLICFYDEKVDVFVDDVRQDHPQTRFA
ncbi:MAG: DUF427 domain-containing protein [Actinomycetia bacterium]|nr:DUF427 domain-containing protein [Actinomycetes bacterium]